MPRRSSAGSRASTERPSSRMSPPVNSIMRLTSRIAVVLPEPDGPTRTHSSPAATSSDRSAIARDRAAGERCSAGRDSAVAASWLGKADGPSSWAVLGGVTEKVLLCSRQGERRRTVPAAAGKTELLDAGRAPRGLVRRVLQTVVERCEGVLEAQRRGDQPVREPRVLRQQGPVEVRPDDLARPDALVAGGPGVAVARQDAPERLRPRSEVRAAPVVLEAGEHRPPAAAARRGQLDLDRDVAD